MHCTGCGNKLADNTVFCTSCGRQVNNNTNTGFGSTTSSSFGGAPPPFAQTQTQAQTYPDQKSKIVAGLLALFIGTFGVHNFYLGFTGRAVTQLLLTISGFILIIPLMITGIWAFIEGIMILCNSNGKDARGVPLSN